MTTWTVTTMPDDEGIPEECQLCRPLDYRGDDINEPTLTTLIARDDGGTKFVYHCRRCGEELWDNDENDPFTDRIETTG